MSHVHFSVCATQNRSVEWRIKSSPWPRVSLATDEDQNSIITFYEQDLNLCLMGKKLNSEFSAGVLKSLMRAVLGMRPQY